MGPAASQASSASAERVFKTLSDIVTKNRNALGDDSVDDILVIHDNWHLFEEVLLDFPNMEALLQKHGIEIYDAQRGDGPPVTY